MDKQNSRRFNIIVQKNKTQNVRNGIRKHTLFITVFFFIFILFPKHIRAQSSLPHSPSNSKLSDDVILSITTRLDYGWAKKWTSKGTGHTYVKGRYFLLVRLHLKGPQAIHNMYTQNFCTLKYTHTHNFCIYVCAGASKKCWILSKSKCFSII